MFWSKCNSIFRTNRRCYCKPLFTFNNRTQNCQCINSNTYGINCTQQCPLCLDIHAKCDSGLITSTGKYFCQSPFIPIYYYDNNHTQPICDCTLGYAGINCTLKCPNCTKVYDSDSYCNSGINGDGSCTCSCNNYINTSNGCKCLPGHYGSRYTTHVLIALMYLIFIFYVWMNGMVQVNVIAHPHGL